MAFPFESTGYESMKEPLLRFATKVDGMAVAAERVKIPVFTAIGKTFQHEGYNLAVPFAMVKNVYFEEGQRRTVLVDYVIVRADVYGGRVDEYVLHTGATWAGKIGQCTVTVDWSSVNTMGMPSLAFEREDSSEYPVAWSFTAPCKATATISDFEPDFDLSLNSVEHYWHVTLNGKRHDTWHGMAVHRPSFSGDHADPLVLTEGLYDFFTESYSNEREKASGPVANEFGNSIQVVSGTSIKTGLGKVTKLGRGVLHAGSGDESVYLKDVVEALGGTFTWVPEWKRIDITMPTRKSQLPRVRAT
jgi:hypothetical protein